MATKVNRYVYRISVLEPFTDWNWKVRFTGVTRRHLRQAVDRLTAEGYDRETSISIEKEKGRAQRETQGLLW